MTDFRQAIPQSAYRPAPAAPVGIRLADLAGMTEARQWGEATARDLALYKQGKLTWKDIDPGCLLFGAPGTGKTTYAKALAATCGVPLVATSFSEWQSADGGHLGSTMSAMKETFARAAKQAPAILFIDELDSIPKRGGGKDESYWTAFVNALLKEFDLIAQAKGVIVVGACNHPELLDSALVRSGRMDRMIGIPMPSTEDLAAILRFHLGPADRAAMMDLPHSSPVGRIALLCSGMSGADVEKAVRGARRLARNNGRAISEVDFVEVLDPPSKRPDRETLARIAVHEAGHAIAALRLEVSREITASVVTAGGEAGRISLRGGKLCKTQKDMDDQIVVALAGRAAEDIIFGNVSELSGGDSKDSDLARATRHAADAMTKFGFSKSGRLQWHAEAPAENAALGTGPLSEELKLILDYAYEKAKALISGDVRTVRALSEALIERRVLSHAEIVGIAAGRDDRRIPFVPHVQSRHESYVPLPHPQHHMPGPMGQTWQQDQAHAPWASSPPPSATDDELPRALRRTDVGPRRRRR